MKTNSFLIILGTLFYFLLSCEEVIKVEGEIDVNLITDGDTLNIPPADSTDVPGGDDPTDTISDSFFDPYDYPLCDSVLSDIYNDGYLWVCGYSHDYQDMYYESLPGKWYIFMEELLPPSSEDHTAEYFGIDEDYTITFNDDHTFVEIYDGVIKQQGIWEVDRELGARIALLNEEDELMIFNISGDAQTYGGNLQNTMRIYGLDRDDVLIIVREIVR